MKCHGKYYFDNLHMVSEASGTVQEVQLMHEPHVEK